MPPRPPRLPLTHFLCLPLVNASSKSQLSASLQHFTAAVTSPSTSGTSPTPSPSTIPPKAIRPVGTLHLTLGVMSLGTKDRVDAALAFLQSLNLPDLLRKTAPISAQPTQDITTTSETAAGDVTNPALMVEDSLGDGCTPLVIDLKGLHAMHSPTSTSILYASPEDATGCLYPFCTALRSAFMEAGFLVPEERPLLLHATIVNMIYAKDKVKRVRGAGHGKGRRGAGKIDATHLLEEWEGWVWAEGARMEKVAICEMGARVVEGREGEGVVYVEVGGVEMP